MRTHCSLRINHMKKLSDLYLAMVVEVNFISTDTFHNSPLEDQILTCAQGFVSMTENASFKINRPATRDDFRPRVVPPGGWNDRAREHQHPTCQIHGD